MDSPEFDRISSRALSEKMQRQLLGVEDGLRAKVEIVIVLNYCCFSRALDRVWAICRRKKCRQ